eukprot:TRINITY_DN6317_c1_g1_i5.p1 TRINITY_DN6317_c1_g1~~TRINITY_DN6317_c1_g1_i5.p1  ORF type:complete len:1096 (-),score=284.49 TRINITY_DN6317_c1_g1_i5:1921-5136(-)
MKSSTIRKKPRTMGEPKYEEEGKSNPTYAERIPDPKRHTVEEVESYIQKNPNGNIKMAEKIPCASVTPELLNDHLFVKGTPLILSGCTSEWISENQDLFTLKWLKEHFDQVPLEGSPRNCKTGTDLQGWTMGRYLDYIQVEGNEKSLYYGKDLPCPNEWKDFVFNNLPVSIRDRVREKGTNDLLGDLPKELQPENLMTYIGAEGTFTPGHRDIAGALGHNLMIKAYPPPGDSDISKTYALWHMITPSDRTKAHKYWKKFDGSLDHDSYYMNFNELTQADFDVWVIVQREGDFVFVPPLAPHQVINQGGIGIKFSWNTISPQSAMISYNEIEYYRNCFKPQVYRIKASVFEGLKSRIKKYQDQEIYEGLGEDLGYLIDLFANIISEEVVDVGFLSQASTKPLPKTLKFTKTQSGEDDFTVKKYTDDILHSRTCNACKCDIFNRVYHCEECTSDEMDICLDCVIDGRGCKDSKHKKKYILYEHYSIPELKQVLAEAKEIYSKLTNTTKETEDDKSKLSTATIAVSMLQVLCERGDEFIWCHQCKQVKKPESSIECTNIECKLTKPYCAPCLWNRYGMKISKCWKDKNWICPSCQKTCNCAACLRDRDINPLSYNLNLQLEQFRNENAQNPGFDGVAIDPDLLAPWDMAPRGKAAGVRRSKKREMEFAQLGEDVQMQLQPKPQPRKKRGKKEVSDEWNEEEEDEVMEVIPSNGTSKRRKASAAVSTPVSANSVSYMHLLMKVTYVEGKQQSEEFCDIYSNESDACQAAIILNCKELDHCGRLNDLIREMLSSAALSLNWTSTWSPFKEVCFSAWDQSPSALLYDVRTEMVQSHLQPRVMDNLNTLINRRSRGNGNRRNTREKREQKVEIIEKSVEKVIEKAVEKVVEKVAEKIVEKAVGNVLSQEELMKEAEESQPVVKTVEEVILIEEDEKIEEKNEEQEENGKQKEKEVEKVITNLEKKVEPEEKIQQTVINIEKENGEAEESDSMEEDWIIPIVQEENGEVILHKPQIKVKREKKEKKEKKHKKDKKSKETGRRKDKKTTAINLSHNNNKEAETKPFISSPPPVRKSNEWK